MTDDAQLSGDSSSGSHYVREVHGSVGVFGSDSSSKTQEAEGTDNLAEVAKQVAREHMAGRCNPCIFYATKQGCRFGDHCRFCHETHQNRCWTCNVFVPGQLLNTVKKSESRYRKP